MQLEANVIPGDQPDFTKSGALYACEGTLLGKRSGGAGHQHCLTCQMEAEMADRLQEEFLALPRGDMRRGAFNQPSKGSSAWITALSNNDGALCNAAFVISAAAWAGLPQPICAPYLRMPIRTKVGRRYGLALDAHGINITSSWRHLRP